MFCDFKVANDKLSWPPLTNRFEFMFAFKSILWGYISEIR
jgi:hypothetical protein